MAITVSRPDLESLIGPECAAWLLARYGGLSIYIPKREGAGQAIMDVVGPRAFKLLQDELGGMNVNLPSKVKVTIKDLAIPLIEQGLSLTAIAQRLGCTVRNVCYVKQAMGLTTPSPRRKPAPKPRMETERTA